MGDKWELCSQFRRSREFASLDLRPEKELLLQLPDAPETQPVDEATDVSRTTTIDLGVLEETPRSDAH